MGVKGQLSERVRASLQSIQASGNQLLALINDVLEIAKVEAGESRNCNPANFAPTTC